MANIYDMASAIQQPNAIGNFNQGVKTGQQNQVFGEQQAAYQQALTKQQQVQNLAPQIIAGDPNAADQAAAIDPTQAAQYQDAATQHIKRIQGAVNYIDSQKTPEAKEAAYQQVKPYLSQFGTPPATFAEAAPKMEAARAQIAQLGQAAAAKLINVGAGGAVFDPETKQAIYTNPGVSPKPQLIQAADGSYIWASPTTGATPLTYGAGASQGVSGAASQPAFQTQITPASPVNAQAVTQANALLAQGMQPTEVMQQLVKAHPDQQFQLALDPATGQFKDVSDGSAQVGASTPAGVSQGAPVMGPKKAGQETKPPTGYQYNADHTSLMPIPGGPADKGQAASPLGDPAQTGDAYLASINDPAMQSMIKAVAEGRMPLPKIYRSGKAGEIGPTQIAQAVSQYDPSYDQADPTSRIKARNDFTSGKSAVQLRQLNTLLGHLGGLSDAADKLDNTGFTPLNTVANAIGSTANTKVSNFNAAAGPAAEEFAALLKGGVPSVEEIKAAQARLNANMTPEQLNGSIGTMAAQIQSRIAALHAQAQNSLGPFAHKVTIITSEGQSALDKLREKGLIGKFDMGEAGGAPDQGAAPSPVSQGGWSIQRVQ